VFQYQVKRNAERAPVLIVFQTSHGPAPLLDELRAFLKTAGFRAGEKSSRRTDVDGPGNTPEHWETETHHSALGDVDLEEDCIGGRIYLEVRRANSYRPLAELERRLALDPRFTDTTFGMAAPDIGLGGGPGTPAPWMKKLRTKKDDGTPEFYPVRAHYSHAGLSNPRFPGPEILASPGLLSAFFNTLSFHLEKDGWGTRFPALLRELHVGFLRQARVTAAIEELNLARSELRQHPGGVIWDYRQPTLAPPSAASSPSGDGLQLGTSSLDQAFQPPGRGGYSLFDILGRVLLIAASPQARFDIPGYDLALITEP